MFYPILPSAYVYKEEHARVMYDSSIGSDQKHRVSRFWNFYLRLRDGIRFSGIHGFLEQRVFLYR